MGFERQLAFGRVGESAIAQWLKARGNSVLPVYEKEYDDGKGPRLFTPDGQFAAPDMFLFPQMEWAEAKHKTVFSWHRLSGKWCTGIDQNHYEHYLLVQHETGRRVWMLFLHRSSTPDPRDLVHGCPLKCPTGLFGGSLDYLSHRVNHRHVNHGRHGMVYWAHETLRLLAPINELRLEAA